MKRRSLNHRSQFQAGALHVATTPARGTAIKSRTHPTTSTLGAIAGSANRAASGHDPKAAGTLVRNLVTPTTANRADRKGFALQILSDFANWKRLTPCENRRMKIE